MDPSNVAPLAAAYILLINLTGFVLVWVDKRRAASHNWRIPERMFFVFALLGAGIGELLSMHRFRHKTKHNTFVFGIPVITILVYGLAFWLLISFL